MQQQVMKRNMSSEMGWGSGGGDGWGQHSAAPGSGSWTSTANTDSTSTWQVLGKPDTGSDLGLEESGATPSSSSGSLPTSQSEAAPSSQPSSSSPWTGSVANLPGMDSNPWASTASSLGWSTNPTASLSLSTPGGPSSTGGGWPPSVASSNTAGASSTQWGGNSLLGSVGEAATGSGWGGSSNSSTQQDTKDWASLAEKDQNWDPSKWGDNPDMSFAQATLKGLKMPPAAPQPPLTTRQEEILRAIENHEGWGSRPIRQDTSWDIETSPKSHRKFSAESNAGASNVWNNSNGTAIWEAVRENQSGNWAGPGAGPSWNNDKDHPSNWGPPKPSEPSSWGATPNGSDPKGFGTWGGAPGSGAGDASNKMWGGGQSQKTDFGSWGDAGSIQRPTNISSWGDDGETGGWDDPRRMQGMVPPSPSGMMPGMGGMGPDGWPDKSWQGGRPKMEEPWSKPPPPKMSGWGDVGQDPGKVDDGTGIWASNNMKVMPPQQNKGPAGWGGDMNSQWNMAVGAKPKMPSGWDEASWVLAQRAKQMPPKHMMGGNHPPTQMRAKLLQHLMDMGFRKEEAQNALITNNMNVDMAIHDLKNNGMPRKDLDDMFQHNGGPNRMPYMPKGLDDLNDNRHDQVPNFQNTPFPNAQGGNQPFLPSTASLPPSSQPSINNPSLQHHKMMQHKMHQVPPSLAGPRGQMPPVGSGSAQVPQQQQQILAQLRQAVSNGYISQQLLNYQLPHNILVLLQQLLQLQTARQNMMTKLQQARLSGQGNRSSQPQLEQMITNINQQITNLQKQLQQAQNSLLSSQQKLPNMSQQPPSGMMTPVPGQQGAMVDNIDALSKDIANVTMGNQSRLTTQWKMSDDFGDDDKNKGLNLIPGGLNMTRDQTWSSTAASTTSSSNWPSSSENSVSSLASGDKIGSTATSSILSGMTDVIPEFVPGKPWQGLTTKNVEDDPHVTPGSIQRSLSVNRVHDESLNNLDGSSKLNSGSWSSAMSNKVAPVDSLGLSQLGSRPPPSMIPGKGQWGGFNRQASWAGRSSSSAFTQVTSNNWNDGQPSTTWILLKNLNPTLDSATVRALCQQHGALNNFFAQGQAALVQYTSQNVAYVAVQRLNNFQIGNTIIQAELLSESDAQRVVSQIPPPQAPPAASQWSQAPPNMYQTGAPRGLSSDPWASSNKFGGMGGGDPWGNSGGSAGLWDMNSLADHNSNPLFGNILGSESM